MAGEKFMAKRRFIITVSGRVQRVGFRDFAAEIARKLRLTGEVKNSEDPSQVVIVAEGEKSTLEEVVAAIKSAGPPAEIENIEIKQTLREK
ncbi:MAG: acylphosphatase [Candidatus Micrarchaeota archaeon]|nr:acylphosphatase [Candidatus Micrarchaeota archaeon]